ncbi:TonB-dependent receptor [Rhabdobacter roseus]|uniref:Outer membrane receptor protein involved in Fe transport n=1 Tax=Rhabdobacter roseus TaxID=1655419 RepID=A0A840TPL5_9BACT|nr:TonB-dependent receptor [Rhabdobacter roseus]MBB5285721.1 outer membrane receptor protein involved in Fe transport [Rhabdobacter roseus]
MRIYLLAGLLVLLGTLTQAQRVTGTVYEQGPTGKVPLPGANVYWAGTTLGTSADEQGRFSMPRSTQSNRLVVSFVGYINDTLTIGAESEWEVVLKSEQTLEEVVVQGNSTAIDRLSPTQTEIITSRALAKAACCNLSESFETNASVSVSYGDAVTGAKQIQMLGLSGTYIQTNVENIPAIRGLATTFGLNYVPGTWIESIDIGKGAGSVVNGYEGMTGQINVELQKPDGLEKLHFNAYVNNFGRGELNLNLAHELSDKWSVGLLSHASTLRNRVDNNRDGFLDLPLYTQFNAINRWKYQSEGLMAQFGVKALHETRQGGQMAFRPGQEGTSPVYGFGNNVSRYEVFSKVAKLFPHQPYKGLGLIVNASVYDGRSYFGRTRYDGRQGTFYGNLVYQSIISNTNHSFKTGLSYLLDDYHETYRDTTLARTESVPGTFFEYTYNYLDKFVLVAGTRLDVHNLVGTQFTPRLHLKYDLDAHTTLRASAGRGFRMANPLAEYYGNLVSSRTVVFLEQLRPEVSWNYGLSLTRDLHLGGMHATFIVDYYRTQFENQLVADMERPGYLYFYNLQDQAYANSFQAELNVTPAKRFELKLAYRLFDVKQTLGKPFDEQILLPRMMINRDRVLFNAGYALPYDKWKFDLTVQWNGTRRIPRMGTEHEHGTFTYQNMAAELAPAFYNLNAQVTRTFPKWDVYLGGENLNNFRQANPILGASNPFGRDFDAGQVWGPVVGRTLYAGIRYKIK